MIPCRLVALALLFAAPSLHARTAGADPSQGTDAPATGEPAAAEDAAELDPEKVEARYGDEGLELRSADGNWLARVTLRAQLRASYPFEEDPDSPDDFERDDEGSFAIQRLRFKWGGHAIRPWIDYYLEYEIADTRLLDLRFTFEKWEAFQFRVGQWKPEYNRERRDSSGEQQLVDRSIANRTFTLDRQSGVMASGRLARGTRADSHWWVGLLNGEGLGEYGSEGEPLRFARWQWNFTGREPGFTQSDVERKAEAHGAIAVAAARNRSRFTRFSSDGGGELAGFPSDVAERWEIEQAVVDAAFHQRGFSFQAELHRKEVEDRLGLLAETAVFRGGYVQAGYFFHGVWSGFPAPLELAVRGARVEADPAPQPRVQDELTLGANWFFRGHRNKLSADVSRLGVEEGAFEDSDVRFRLQWDVSF